MEEKKPVQYQKIAGILYCVSAASTLTNMLNYFSFFTLLNLACLGVIIFALFTNRRDIVLLIGVAGLALLQIYTFFSGFGYNAYSVYNGWDYGHHFNLFCMIPALLRVAACIALLLIVAVNTLGVLPQYREMAGKLWFVPGAAWVGSYVVTLVVGLGIQLSDSYWPYYYSFGGSILTIVFSLIPAAAQNLLAMWVSHPNGVDEGDLLYDAVSAGTQKVPTSGSVIYCGMVKHILLLLLTCGIWLYIWIYRVTGYLNKVEGEEYRNPTTKLLLCMFVPFYSIYWTYKSAQRIDKLAASHGIPSDISVLCLILELFVAIVPPIIMQDKLNSIVNAENAGASGFAPVQTYQAPASQSYARPTAQYQAPAERKDYQTVADELKTYKELLDCGIITEEEFEAKKKQLLNL